MDAAELKRMQSNNYALAREWYELISLDLAGVNLGQCVEYHMLQLLNAKTQGVLDAEE